MMCQLVVRLFVLSVFVSGLVGCAGKPKPTPQKPAINADAFMQLVETLCDPKMQGRDAGTEGIGLARDLMVDHFKALGLEPAFVIDGKPSYTQPFELRIGLDDEQKPIYATVENVGALLPGHGDLKNEVVVVGGHYDHIGYGSIGSRARDQRGQLHPGADDNASGTAGVMLLAEYFNDARLASTMRGGFIDTTFPRRTILFTGFAGEECGLLGSRYMTRNPDQWAFDAKEVTGMINLDMIGRLRNDELYIFTDATGKQWRDWINTENQNTKLALQWDVRPPGGSDHSLFIAIGVPAVFFNTWLHDDYHTPRDTPDKINADGAIAVLNLVAGLAERAATARERITFVAPKPRAPRPYLGVRLGQADGGVLIEDVLKDGPLDKAGAAAGDTLLSIGDKTTSSPGDVRSFLAKAKAGTEVKISIKRDEETKELTVLLGVRR